MAAPSGRGLLLRGPLHVLHSHGYPALERDSSEFTLLDRLAPVCARANRDLGLRMLQNTTLGGAAPPFTLDVRMAQASRGAN